MEKKIKNKWKLLFRVQGLGTVPPIKENQIAKKMEIKQKLGACRAL